MDLSDKLVSLNLLNIFVEGGGKVFASFIKEGLVDRFYHFISPKVIGGDGVPLFGDLNCEKIEDAYKCKLTDTKRFEEDILHIYKFNDYTNHVLQLTEKFRNRCKYGCSQG